MSYVRSDDEHEDGRLTEFCKRLSAEVQMQTGKEFPIFQDRKDIKWGQTGKQRIEDSIDATTFLIPIVTPSYFNSPPCREELERFLERERELNWKDLLLPVYYVGCPLLDDDDLRKTDPLAEELYKRQWADWRELRFSPFTSPEVRSALARLAQQIRDAIGGQPAQAAVPAVTDQRRAGLAEIAPTEESGGAPSPGGHSPPTAKTEPPTRVVDQMGRGHHTSLVEAIREAKPGDRILVRPGLYQEGIVINKPLEIIGDGAAGDVTVQATGSNAILFATTMGRVVNMTLRQLGGSDWFAVDIRQGRLELEDCDVSSQSLSCVGIHGGADPRLRRNCIHDGKQSGVFVYANGQGTLEDNDIFGNALSGVEIRDGGNPTVRRNRIHDGKTGGVNVHDNGQGTLEDNDIFGNALSGIEIQGGNPTVRRNRIHDGKTVGVYVHANGQGTLEDNDIFGNALSGVEIRDGGNPTVRRNRIHDGKTGGVHVDANGQGTLEDNDIFGNALSGVEIRDGGNPIVRRNRIHDGKAGGVHVDANGQGTLEDNDIFCNALSGVEIRDGGNPTVRRNRVNRNGHWAIRVSEKGGGTLEDNDLRENARGAWDISADSLRKVKRARNLE